METAYFDQFEREQLRPGVSLLVNIVAGCPQEFSFTAYTYKKEVILQRQDSTTKSVVFLQS